MSVFKSFVVFLFCFLIVSKLSARVLDEKGSVMPQVQHLLVAFYPLIEKAYHQGLLPGVSQKTLISISSDGFFNNESISLDDLNTIAQAVFLRPFGLERKDLSVQGAQLEAFLTPTVWEAFKAMGDLSDKLPDTVAPDYILVHGSTVNNMRERIKFLIDCLEAGQLHINLNTQIVFLTGKRALWAQSTEGTDSVFDEQRSVFLNAFPLKQKEDWCPPDQFPITEDEALDWILQQSSLPSVFEKAKVLVVRAPERWVVHPKTGEKVLQRPTTSTTLMEWLANYRPAPGTVVSISSQPFAYYQGLVTANILNKYNSKTGCFNVEAAGRYNYSEDDFSIFQKYIAVILDNFARVIYEEVEKKQYDANCPAVL